MAATRDPYVGEGADGARRSAQIDREEADTLDRDDPRWAGRMLSAQAWEEQAEQIEATSRWSNCPRCGRQVRDSDCWSCLIDLDVEEAGR